MNVTFRFCWFTPSNSLKLPVFKGVFTDLGSHSFLHISFYPLYSCIVGGYGTWFALHLDDRRGIPGIVDDGKTGFLVPKHDVAVLADQIQLLLNDSVLRSNMGKVGREKFEKEFTLEVFEKRMTWILEHIVYPIFSRMGIERD